MKTPSQDWIEGDAVNNGGYGGATPTFSELQQAGRPRPPAPAYPTPYPSPIGPNPTGSVGFPSRAGISAPTKANDAGGGTTVPDIYSPAGSSDTGGNPAPGGGTTTDSGGPPAPAGTGESDFERQLRERWQSNPNAPQFTSGAHAQTAAEFVPGANPFTPSFQGVTAPSAFKPGQFSGSNAATNALNPAILKSVMDLLQNPSGYTTDVAKSTYDRLGGAIDDQYNVGNQRIDEEMARRGIPVSTIAGGRLFDSNVARKSAKEDLAGRILSDQATTLGSDRARAIQSASGLSADEFNRLLTEYSTNANAGQTGFANEMSSADFQRQEAARKVAEGLSTGTFNENLATDKFNNDFRAKGFNSAEDQRAFDDLLASFNTNKASDAQTFAQGEQKLKDYTDAGQQSFNNQLTTEQTNNQQQQQLMDMLMKLFGGTGGGGTA